MSFKVMFSGILWIIYGFIMASTCIFSKKLITDKEFKFLLVANFWLMYIGLTIVDLLVLWPATY